MATQNESWTDKDGNKRRTAEVVADNVYFGDSKKEASSGGSYGGAYTGTDSGFYRDNSTSNVAPTSDFAMLEDDDAQLTF